MDFSGRYWLAAARPEVWRALNDTEILKATIPGCQSISYVDEAALELKIAINLGVVKPVFSGDLFLTNVIAAQSYTLSGRGRGGLMGHAAGQAAIELSDMEAGTALVFSARGGASEGLMRLGKGLLGARAQKVIDGFFVRFADAMGVELQVLGLEA